MLPILAGLLSIWTGAGTLYAQSEAEAMGIVVDAQTGEPLKGAHVFLSGTKIGTATDRRGHYRLRSIPPGGYRLVVSIIGYKTAGIDIVIGPGETLRLDYQLNPVVYEMPEIYVGNLDKKWKKSLEQFTHYFIGDTQWADSVKILNPEVLRFEKSWWGRLSAEALAPLKIENRALGYRITYHLKEFEHSGTLTRWDGDPLFTEMVPDDSLQAAVWERNRKKAFYGSLRHFILAMLQNRIREEGFIVYNLRKNIRGLSPHRFPVSARRYLSESEDQYLQHLNFFGRLEIIYTEDGEDRNYVRWQRLQRPPARSQTSYLELNEHPITVDDDGEILEPYGATQFGYFSYERLGDATPREYRPDDYPRLN
ncbi:MAG: carboxypeptidase-like regulatory domain-containing protein [Balneolaceae bacterium]|nr:carboxypeptidase-like regulatory domain-containing protein [Balneolaceae bacterium]